MKTVTLRLPALSVIPGHARRAVTIVGMCGAERIVTLQASIFRHPDTMLFPAQRLGYEIRIVILTRSARRAYQIELPGFILNYRRNVGLPAVLAKSVGRVLVLIHSGLHTLMGFFL